MRLPINTVWAAGLDIGKGEKLSKSHAQAMKAALLFSFSPFPVTNPASPLCRDHPSLADAARGCQRTGVKWGRISRTPS